MLLCLNHFMFMGRKCLRKRNNLDSLCYLHSISALSVNRVNGIGKIRFCHLNFGQNCIVRHPFHATFLSAVDICDAMHRSKTNGITCAFVRVYRLSLNIINDFSDLINGVDMIKLSIYSGTTGLPT